MATCQHTSTRVISTRCYSGPVSSINENPAAHGGVCDTDECLACGSRRRRLVNQWHEECGEWGLSLAQRQRTAADARAVARRLIELRPAPITLVRGAERATVSLDADGYLVLEGGAAHPEGHAIYRACPSLVDYARKLRLAVLRAAELEQEV